MYLKISAFVIVSVLFTGCSFSFSPKPKKPDLKPVKNVQSVKIVDNNETVNAVNAESNITVVQNTPIKETPVRKAAPALKPEPFSLESNEQDPELLGPQSTLKGGLLNKIENEESPAGDENKSEDLTKQDEKKETL